MERPRRPWVQPSDRGHTRARFGRIPQVVSFPTEFTKSDKDSDKPDADLKLQWAHGYNGGVLGSLHWTSRNEFIFPLSGMCVVQTLNPPSQRFFKGHSKEVTCLAYNAATRLCVSGQNDPFASILAVCFSPRGDTVFTLGGDGDHLLAAWTQFLPATMQQAGNDFAAQKEHLPSVFRTPYAVIASGKSPAYGMSVCTSESSECPGMAIFATFDGGIGDKGMVLKFWNWTPNGTPSSLSSKLAVFSKGSSMSAPRKVICCTWTSKQQAVVCGDNGVFYLFEGNTAIFQHRVCQGPLGCGAEVLGIGFVFGSQTATLYFGSSELPPEGSNAAKTWLTPLRPCDFGASLVDATAKLQMNTIAIQPVSPGASLALIGTADHHLLLLDLTNRRLVDVLQIGHSSETWALAFHPGGVEGDNQQILASGSSAGKVRFWSTQGQRPMPIIGRVLDFTKKSTWWPSSKTSKPQGSLNPVGVTALHFSPAGDLMAIGHQEGTVRVYAFPELQPVFEYLASKMRERIWDVRFDPSGRFCAAASSDQHVYLFRIADDGRILAHRTLIGNTSTVTHVQFSNTGSQLMTNSGDGQLLYFSTETGDRIKSGKALQDVIWATPWECTCGWPVVGMWSANKNLCINDINACSSFDPLPSNHRGSGAALLASGDDLQMVKLYRFPAVAEDQEYREYNGHSSHVSQVRFSPSTLGEKPLLVSAGGVDHALLQWEVEALTHGQILEKVRNQPWIDPTPWKQNDADSNEPVSRRMSLSSKAVGSKGKARAASCSSTVAPPWATGSLDDGIKGYQEGPVLRAPWATPLDNENLGKTSTFRPGKQGLSSASREENTMAGGDAMRPAGSRRPSSAHATRSYRR